MSFVNNDIFPGKFLQGCLLPLANLVGSDADIEFLSEDGLLTDRGSLILVSSENDGPEPRNPVCKFTRPVVESRFGNNDEMRARDVAMNL